MTPETKQAFDEATKAVHDLRAEVDALKGKSADVIDAAKLAKAEADLATKFDAEQKAIAERLDKIETAANRPGVAGNAEKEDKHAEMIDAYLRKGAEPDELKAMASNSQTDGGVMIHSAMREGIQTRLRRSSAIRELASVITFDGGSYDILVERGDAGYEWAGETQERNETGTPTINRISISTHELSAMPKVSQFLLNNASFDLESFLVNKVTDRFIRAEEGSFLNGNGVNKPKGLLTYAMTAQNDAERAAEKFQFRNSGANGDIDGDVLVKAFYDLQGAYQANATWLMKNSTAARVATLKDGDGNFMLREILNGDGNVTRTIQGRPISIADDMPALAAGSLSLAVGDIASAYTIVDGKSVTVLRDPFSAKPNVLFYCTKRVGGGATDFDAVKFIKASV
ncbi:phage major capsid protein, HK97 family [Cribrihabitans marinus]|uniref:Phage major capsid protein, HK97 family n=1 Tax=Cribrihabitans marinus TaxID=1227549 RepID=A0A1H6WG86_9RHOB|nr:phage major capsid protein [Cribrihabitans marinus]GGH24471.1 phage capsid protein [Cribrihabitans marinus]SEJ13127.1 phage major capsid protein, HK97 family [Cribrihabitans marinus]